MLLFLINKSLKPRKNNTLVLILHILTQKLHWKPAGINKDSNFIVKHSGRQTLQSFWTGHWNQKPKIKHQICTCRLDWESHKISRTDFPLRQDCLSIGNTMPSRFQTRSLGDCHQNLWSTEHWLWIKKVRLYVQFKSQWDYCKLTSRIQKRERKKISYK